MRSGDGGVSEQTDGSIPESLAAGVVDLLKREELATRLASGRPLRVKAGFDPTAPDLHLGHTVLLNKLARFVELGHHAVVIIGDFTAMIGDPTGRNITRRPLTREEIEANARTYREQLLRVIPEDRVEVRCNTEWLSRMDAADMIRLAARQTVARMLEREDFSQRFHSGQSIALHEFLYPLVQGHDSVVVRADVELGGTDQLFNLLMGRQLQEDAGLAPQVVMTMPLLEGLDGVHKMSKSLGNTVGITDAPEDMYGKVMSVSDTLMWRWYELLSLRGTEAIEALRRAVAEGRNPRDVKDELARELVARFHSPAAAERAARAFRERFACNQVPEDMPEFELPAGEEGLTIAVALREAGLTSSTSESLRMVTQGAVRLDGERVAEGRQALVPGAWHVLQVGKRRWARVRCRPGG
jgi:tyrosyl-tRNA synthetase